MKIASPLRRLELRHATWSLDLATVALLAALCGGFWTWTDWLVNPNGTEAKAYSVSAIMIGSMLWRRRHPLVVMSVVIAGCIAQCWWLEAPTVAVVVVPLTVYSVARWVHGRLARVVLVPAVIGSAVAPWRWSNLLMTTEYHEELGGYERVDNPTWLLMLFIFCLAVTLTAYAIGRRLRESSLAQQERLVAQHQRHVLELAEREQAARTAEATVRAQIARELHDVVAHSLSVMVVQAEGGRAVATKKPELAAQALDTIAETGREALQQMRRIVGVLRDGPDERAEFAPSPGLSAISELVERSGDRVELVVTGRTPTVPPTLGLVVYRITQEAITNFLKHAGAEARCRVQLSYSPEVIVAEISDDGVGSSSSDDGHGNGLRGMKERVSSMGGQLVARPRKGGGFLVRAVLPVPRNEPGGVAGVSAPLPPHWEHTRSIRWTEKT